MKRRGPVFGPRLSGVTYTDRPGAYAIIATDDLLAFVLGPAGRLHLPGGGAKPGEPLASALLREIAEEIGWRARIQGLIGHATQFLFAEGEGYFAVRATYFRAELIEPAASLAEHDIMWLAPNAAVPLMARASDAWAISRGRQPEKPGGVGCRRHGCR